MSFGGSASKSFFEVTSEVEAKKLTLEENQQKCDFF
jgi:hypothetical protein